jgi:hypothetical protein
MHVSAEAFVCSDGSLIQAANARGLGVIDTRP